MGIEQHRHIVFGVDHYNPLGIVRSLGEGGVKSTLIVVDSDRPAIMKSRYVMEAHQVKSIEEGYQLLIGLYGKEKMKPFVYSADDVITGYINNHYDEMKDRFFFFNAGGKGRLANYVNKDNLYKLALKCGLNVLDEIVVDKGMIPDNINYPIITKDVATTSYGWKGDVYICYSNEELTEAYKKIKSEKVILQRYINKKNEYCLEGFSAKRGEVVAIAIACTYKYLLPDSYSPYMNVYNFDNKDLFDKIKKMFREIGFEGIFEIEFLVDQDDTIYFGEINFRNSTWSYASTCAGMNLPINWSYAMLNGDINKNFYKKVPKNFTAMNEFDDFKRVSSKKITIFHWLWDVLNCHCRYNMGRRDFIPFLKAVEKQFSNKLKRTRYGKM